MDRKRESHFIVLSISLVVMAIMLMSCRTKPVSTVTAENMVPTTLFLAPGDVLDISFLTATNFSGLRRIGPEGTITMPIIGAYQAGGKTALEVESEMEKLYAKELQDPELFVNVASSGNVIYVTGSVGRPGRVQLDRPLTALEAILEVGGATPDANLEKVTVIRYEGPDNKTFELNLEPVYSGGPVPPFYLKPRDAVHVPKKVQWF